MPQSLSQIILHIVFSTKDRVPFINPEIEEELHAYLGGVLRNIGCPAIAIGGPDDHIHILCRLSRTCAVSDLIEEIKTSSSKWIKTKGPNYRKFSWQGGYGAFSIGQSQVEAAVRYVRNQREHHRKNTFKEEFLKLLEKYEVDWDERYVWG